MLESSFYYGDAKDKLIIATLNYQRCMVILKNKNEDFSSDELLQCKCLINCFCSVVVRMLRRKTLAIYFHIMISNHTHDHVLEWGNLCTHLQQGWEALKLLIKYLFLEGLIKVQERIITKDQD